MSSRADVLNNNTNSFPNNNSGQITPAVLRDFNADFINSVQFIGDPTISASFATSASIASRAVSSSFASNAANASSASYALTASFALNGGGGGTVNTGSLLTTASVSDATITFTKGDASTFGITVDNVASASYALNASNASNATSASFATQAANASNSVNAQTASYTPNAIITASVNISTLTFTKGDGTQFNLTVAQSGSVATASYATFAVSASYAVTSSVAVSSSYTTFASTASSADVFNVRTSLTASGLRYPTTDGVSDQFLSTDGAGNLTFNWVKTLHQNIRNRESVAIVRGTPLFTSGSTGDNVDVFIADASNPARRPATLIAFDATLAPSATGTAIISGEIQGVNTTGYPAGTVIYLAPGGSWTSTRPTGSSSVQVLGVVTLEGNNGRGIVFNQVADTLPNIQAGYTWVGDTNGVPQAVPTSSIRNVVSSSYSSFAATIPSGLNITASNITVTNNLVVNGTASFGYLQTVSGSAIIIGEQYIVLNADTPTAPFAGIQVYDTGSASTASFEWNGVGDYWIGVEETGQSYGFLTGVTSSKGNEIFPAVNTLVKGTGFHELKDSNIIDNGSIVSINSNTSITGSLVASAGFTGSLAGTASFANYATNAGIANSATSASIANTAVTASHALNAVSASYATFAATADIATSTTSASYALSASYAMSASFARSASYAPVFPYTGAVAISGSTGIRGNFSVTGSTVLSGSLSVFGSSTFRATANTFGQSTFGTQVTTFQASSSAEARVQAGPTNATASLRTTTFNAAGETSELFIKTSYPRGTDFMDSDGATGIVLTTFLHIPGYLTTPTTPGFTRGLNVTGSLNVTAGITGSLLGTASFATNATSASFATSAASATSASIAAIAVTASHAIDSVTASYALNAASSSYALTASYAANAGSGGVQGSEIYSYTFLLMGA